MELEVLTTSPSVSTRRIYMHSSVDALTLKRKIIIDAVLWKNNLVVVREEHDGRRSLFVHLFLVTVEVNQVLFGILANQPVTRTFMSIGVVESDNRIEQYLEVRSSQTIAVRCNRRSQMSASRRPHDSHLVGTYAPLLCIGTDNAQSLLRIAYRNFSHTMRHAVLQHYQRNALFVEERRPFIPFMSCSKMRISTARTAHHCHTVGLVCLRKEHTHRRFEVARRIIKRLGFVYTITIRESILPQINVECLLCQHRTACHKQGGNRCKYPFPHNNII